MTTNPLFITDAYKLAHRFQYPEKTRWIYANLTPRSSRIPGVSGMVFFGLQYFIKRYLQHEFDAGFFSRPKAEVMREYERRIKTYIGGLPNYEHIAALHDLGYLPVRIKALPEGTVCPVRVPCLTISNTLAEFFWLTNYLETLMSNVLWQPCTSATIANEYRKILDGQANATGMPMDFVQWQGHDFSCRGMSSPESSMTSGMGHLLSFTGTDTLLAIEGAEAYYNADSDKEMIGGSVAATEHSVMCCGMEECEMQTFQRLLKVYPSGILSVVSDTWDLWRVLTSILPALKQEIMARDGKLVIRPDSGNPADILCGNPNGKTVAEKKGVVELLWDVFGGTESTTGDRILDSHVGAIYGDSITLDRAREIGSRLAAKQFASQVVFGIGSYTYQHVTRDTFGTAIKATAVVVGDDGTEIREISKNPITDDGIKKSACGLLRVVKSGDTLVLEDRVDKLTEETGELRDVFQDGKLLKVTTLREIRKRLHPNWNP